MHIIRPQQGNEIRCVTRLGGPYASLYIIDESTNKEMSLSQSGPTDGINGYNVFYVQFAGSNIPVEGRFYTFFVYNNDGVQYKGRLFCTAQTDYDKYTVNQNVYTEEQSADNEFILL